MTLPETTVISHLHPRGSLDVADHPVPTGKEEVWRFTPLAGLADFFDDTLGRSALGEGPYPARGQGYTSEVLAPGQGPHGGLTPVDRAAAIAARDGAGRHIIIDGVAEWVRVGLEPGQPGVPTANHLVIEARPGADGTVIITHHGRARHLGNVEINVGAGAYLTVVSIQNWDRGAVHLGQHEAVVGKDATFRHVVVTLGGDLVRLQTNVSYASTGGRAELYGVYFADAGQHFEHRLFVDHNRPKGTSLVDYRGALQGEHARSVWVGDVLIRPEARGIETYESNKNLILTDGARADAVPNLEIETGEIIGAGHSASTGRFDDEQLFYLQSRGIPGSEARRLVVRGFFATILTKIGVPEVEELLMGLIDTELAFDKEN
ncbi:MAG: Fe-S cluster assembly protein SufD [Propionibacteriaceae bacterium]|jgi:Fe-S cluster assembly protein SufD|nr:Fe-S cluster assembly protein SufD [Propionibacteriaceae bacterium]